MDTTDVKSNDANTLGLTGYVELDRHMNKNGFLTIDIQLTSKPLSCPVCGGRKLIRHGKIERSCRDIPVDNVPVTLFIHYSRYKCQKCGKVFTPLLRGIKRRDKTTQRFQKALVKASKKMPMSHVAKKFNVTISTVKSACGR